MPNDEVVAGDYIAGGMTVIYAWFIAGCAKHN
jgi:hypothetical protein